MGGEQVLVWVSLNLHHCKDGYALYIQSISEICSAELVAQAKPSNQLRRYQEVVGFTYIQRATTGAHRQYRTKGPSRERLAGWPISSRSPFLGCDRGMAAKRGLIAANKAAALTPFTDTDLPWCRYDSRKSGIQLRPTVTAAMMPMLTAQGFGTPSPLTKPLPLWPKQWLESRAMLMVNSSYMALQMSSTGIIPRKVQAALLTSHSPRFLSR